MKNSSSESYANAGVDITAGYRAVELMKQHIARTVCKGADTDIGGFGGPLCKGRDGCTEGLLGMEVESTLERTGHFVSGVAGEVEGQGVNLALPRYGHLAARYAYPVAVYSLRYPMKPASERERRIEVFGSAADGPGSRVRIVSEVGDYIISTVGEVVFVVVVDTYRLGCKVDAESVARSCIR